ncbi:MAG: fructosamine kinase family protein, partial [Verrucomicrobiae bacterium]|nr:fructosamine kinase family protein [Verrucomicrobiae bacterium]
MWDAVCNRLGEVLGEKVKLNSIRSVSGGCIHQAKALETSSGTYFAKVNHLEALPMFEAEATGLAAIAATKTARCPKVILIDQINGQAVLILEYIPMTSASRGSMTLLGKQLAAMHKSTQEQFGWPEENHIGRTPQTNAPCEDWVEFYRTRRLEFQLKLCRDKGLRIVET